VTEAVTRTPPYTPVKVFEFGVSSASEYWRLITEPDLNEFEVLANARNTAHLAQSLWACWEWFCQETKLDPLSDGSTELMLIRDIAESAKHRALGRRKQPPTTTQLDRGDFGQLAYDGPGGYGVPSGGYATRGPLLTFGDGTTVPFEQVASSAANFIKSKLPPGQ
jgi:hypothetical protein